MKYKTIPGSNGVMIDLNSNFKMKDGSVCELTVENDYVEMELHGVVDKYHIDWLCMIAHYEIQTREEQQLSYIGTWIVTRNKPRAKFWLNYKEPVVVYDEYRVIPQFSRYAISKEGVLIDRNTGNKITVRDENAEVKYFNRTPAPSYPVVDVYDPDKTKKRRVKLHRLVAMTWVVNPDPGIFVIVDHKDTDQRNYHYSNLEWVDDAENLKRAAWNLAFASQPCLLRDVIEDTVTWFPSSKEAFKSIGMTRRILTDDKVWLYRTPLYKGRYEIKLESDTREWAYSKDTLPNKNSRYTITVVKEDGSVEVTEGVTDLRNKYKLWNVSNYVPALVEMIRERNPGWTVTYVDRKDSTPLQALNLETGEVLESETIQGLVRLTGLSKTVIRNAILSEVKYVTSGYLFRRKTDDPWPAERMEKPAVSDRIQATRVDTGESTLYDSLRAAYRATGVMRESIRRAIEEGRPISGWEFRKC